MDTESIYVLYVDDDRSMLALASDVLREEASTLELRTATSATEGLQLLQTDAIECVVSDYNMPSMDGLSFLDEVRKDHPNLPFILFTGRGSEEIASEAISRGVTDYLQKGAGIDQFALLANRIRRFGEQYRTERQLKELRERRAALFENPNDAIVEIQFVDGDPIIEAINPGFERIFGLDESTVRGQPVEDVLVPESEMDHHSDIADSVLAGDRIDTEVQRLTSDGIKTFRLRVFPIEETRGQRGSYAIYTDISERKSYEQHLTTFKTAVENSGHSIYWTDRQGVIQYVNPTFEEVTGYSAEEAIGRTPSILNSGVHDDAFFADLWETITSGEVWRANVVNERKSGEKYVVEQTIAPISDDTGAITSFVTVNADVTDREEHEESLQTERNRFATLFEAIPEPAVLVKYDEGGSAVQDVNEAFTETFGYGAEEAIGQPINELIVPPEHREEAEALDEMALRGKSVTRQVSRLARDGIRQFLVRSAPFDLGDDGVEQFGVYVDITTQMEYEQEIEQQLERLDEFASIVTHDLRNPITIARGRVDLATEECDSVHLEKAVDALKRMDDIVENTLELARQGKIVGQTASIDLRHIIQECWRNVETTDAELELDGSPTIEADPDRIKHLFENLFRNAVTHGGPDVLVRVGECGDGFFVEDDGEGLPKAKRDALFDLTSGDDTTGIGLALVSRIATAHGWEVNVTESGGGGLRFEFTNR